MDWYLLNVLNDQLDECPINWYLLNIQFYQCQFTKAMIHSTFFWPWAKHFEAKGDLPSMARMENDETVDCKLRWLS